MAGKRSCEVGEGGREGDEVKKARIGVHCS